MYTLAVKRDFIAQHFLVGGDWGAENVKHSHHYALELQLQGEVLDQHGYLVDIVEVERHLEEQVAFYRDKTLNDLPPFSGLNPSIEHFARILALALAEGIATKDLKSLTVKLWENDIAWTSYQLVLNEVGLELSVDSVDQPGPPGKVPGSDGPVSVTRFDKS